MNIIRNRKYIILHWNLFFKIKFILIISDLILNNKNLFFRLLKNKIKYILMMAISCDFSVYEGFGFYLLIFILFKRIII